MFTVALLILLHLVARAVRADDYRRSKLLDLVARRDVRREIGATPSQIKQLDEVIERVKRDDLPVDKSRSEITRMLTPNQADRLTELILQTLDGRALEDPKIVEVLNLDEDQQRRVGKAKKANAESEREMLDVMKRARFATADARRQFVEKYHKAANERLLSILSDKQKAHFLELKGKPFPIADRNPQPPRE
jgi:hypothetical protein